MTSEQATKAVQLVKHLLCKHEDLGFGLDNSFKDSHGSHVYNLSPGQEHPQKSPG